MKINQLCTLHSCKVCKMTILDSFVSPCVVSMAPGIAHYFVFKAFAAFCLAFFFFFLGGGPL